MELKIDDGFAQRTVGEVVSENYALASVFKRHGIDFCCGGGRTISEACEREGIAPETLLTELQRHAGRSGAPAADPREWELDFLVDYITNIHHKYVRDQLPVLTVFSKKVARVHGAEHPELVEINALVVALALEMESHLRDEEAILFPYARSLGERQAAPDDSEIPEIDEAISGMISEHDHAGETMRTIAELSGGYQAPPQACNTFRALFALLKEFEDDLHRHVHLENNVLFPQVRSRLAACRRADA